MKFSFSSSFYSSFHKLDTRPNALDPSPISECTHISVFNRLTHSFASDIYTYKPKSFLPYKPNLIKLRPGVIQYTVCTTTQLYPTANSSPIHCHFCSCFSGDNVLFCEETVTTDIIFQTSQHWMMLSLVIKEALCSSFTVDDLVIFLQAIT